jgi:23S rRNA (cytosine1962-C5)-methyltransferase
VNVAAAPSFRDEWVLHRDEDTLVVDKPAGVASHPVEALEVSDIGARLERWLGRRPAVMHALDREASGVMVLGLSREASRGLARQLEAGIGGTHLVATTARPRGIRHEVVRRVGERLLLRLTEVRSMRKALAAAGAPIAGDREHGGAPAPRLLWHVASLALAHPRTGARLPARAALPPTFERWLAGEASLGRFEERLGEACDRRYALAQRDDTDAYRLVHGAGDELPGVEIDVYGEHAVVSLASDEALVARDAIFDAVYALGFRGVYAKLRPRQASTLVDTRREDVAPPHPVRGEAAPAPMWVRELGVAYAVRLGDGLSTGLFLDQRAARGWVKRELAGRSLLNLFAYHGGFTVAAIAGGARRTVTVDASGVALERAAENLAHHAADRGAHALVKADAAEWLATCNERFDVVVLDPPSYSTTKHTTFRAERDYERLAALSIARVARGGHLLASTNLRRMSHEAFRRTLTSAARTVGRTVAKVRALTPPLDHPPPPGEPWHLKRELVELAD